MTHYSILRWAVVALAALGCASHPDTAPLRKVRLSFNPHISWAPLMIARDEGFFRDEGLDVEFVPAMQVEETLVALITGDIDVRPGPIHAAFLSAVAKGARVRIVAGSGILARDACTYFGIVIRPGLDTSGKPVIKRLRTSQDGSTRYIVTRMLEGRGMSLDGIETTRIQNPVVALSLENGSLDAAAITEPALTRVAKVGTLWLSAQDALPDFQWSVLAFSDRLVTKDRDTGIRFLRAYHRAVTQYRLGKTDRNVQIIADGTGETPEHVREACWPVFTADSRVNWESIDAFQRWATAQGFMETVVPQSAAYDSTLVVETAPPNGPGTH